MLVEGGFDNLSVTCFGQHVFEQPVCHLLLEKPRQMCYNLLPIPFLFRSSFLCQPANAQAQILAHSGIIVVPVQIFFFLSLTNLFTLFTAQGFISPICSHALAWNSSYCIPGSHQSDSAKKEARSAHIRLQPRYHANVALHFALLQQKQRFHLASKVFNFASFHYANGETLCIYSRTPVSN